MSARLVPLIPGTAPIIPLQRPVLLIGRHPECDVRIDLPKISRRHCCAALAYERVMIRDLGSRNGLRVNGLLVEEAQLHGGDEVAIGPIIFRVEVETYRPPSPPPITKPTQRAKPIPPKPPSLPSLPNDTGDELIPLDL
jgi:pSer/pThr/pTyr-binding forkhead associated (FHA) protein